MEEGSEFIIDGVHVWEADTDLENVSHVKDASMRLIYKGKHFSFWKYDDIKFALEHGVENFVNDLIQFEKVETKFIDELERFFTEWVGTVEANCES